MKRIVIALITLSICFGGGKLPTQIKALKEKLQNKYQVYSLEDISKLKKQPTAQHERTASRDMEDLVGDWYMEEENIEMFITVGTDQSIPNPLTLMAIEEAEGSVTATASDYETELTYLLDNELMEDGDDCDIYCEGEYNDYNEYGIEPSDIYCECCHEDYPLDDICEDDDNVLANGDFEDVYEAGNGWQLYATDWTWYPTYAVNHHVELSGNNIYGSDALFEAYDGDYSLKLWGQYNGTENQTAYYQTFSDLEAGTEIHAEAMLMSHEDDWIGNGSNTVTVFMSYWDINWGFMGRDDSEVFSGADEYNMWHERWVDAVVPEGVSYVNIGLEFSQMDDSQTGSVYIDNMTVHINENNDDDDDGLDLLIMNMDLMEFFMLMFGMDLDSLGIENPTIIGVSGLGGENVEMVMGIVFVDTSMIELIADSAEVVSSTTLGEESITFDNLSLYDSTGTSVLTISGTIGPGMIDLVAGEETSLDFFNDLFEDDDEGEFYLSFYDDSTGMGVEIEYDDYYGEEYADTSNFDWIATADSLFLYFEGDEYYEDEADTIELAYAVHDVTDDGYFDSLFVNASFEPCEEDDYDSYDDCFEDMELFGLDELEDVESFRVYEELVFSSGGFTSVAPGDGTMPNEFNLYGNYPNPFNPVTSIRFDVGLKSGNNTSLLIYDITGRNVATLINEQLQTGTYEVKWDARGFASGIYFSELISGTNRHTQKMVLLK